MRKTEDREQKTEKRRPARFSWLPFTVFCFLSSILYLSSPSLACPGCKDTISSPENPAASVKLAQGWARSIYLLMWTPYLLFGGVTFAIVRSARRRKENGT